MGSNAKKKITVNCGTTHVSVSVFSERAGSLVLEKLVVEDLVYNYMEEEEWAFAASSALSGIFKKLKLKGGATVIAPGHLLLTKNVKVPQVEASRQRQIISFEAADKFPFPLGDLVWDSQIISTDGVEAEVVLFAIKRENAERFAQQMLRSGITPEIIQPSTNLDYQAYRFLNVDATENVLIVNVGARTTNLTFVTPEGFSIQNVSVGGNFLTQSIADSLGKPFPAAERLKVNFFSDAMDLAEDDPHAIKLREAAQSFCRRLGQEITRRIVNQKRQSPNGVPVKILLTGRGSLLPGLSDSLAESQHLPVEYFEPTAPVQVAAGVSSGYFDSVRFQLSEVIGDASELLDSSVYSQVNLLPQQIADALAFSKKKPFFIAAAVLFALAPLPIFFGLQNQCAALDSENAGLSKRKAELESFRSKISALEEHNVPAAEFVGTLDGVLAARGAWNALLADIQSRVSALQAPTASEDGELTFSANRHIWVDGLKVSRTVQNPQVSEEDDERGNAKPTVRTEVELKLRLLIPQVDGAKPEHNAAAFNARRRAVLDVFKKSEFVEKLTDQTDFRRPNFPTITLKLVLKPEKGI